MLPTSARIRCLSPESVATPAQTFSPRSLDAQATVERCKTSAPVVSSEQVAAGDEILLDLEELRQNPP
jgi:hypothetical protein